MLADVLQHAGDLLGVGRKPVACPGALDRQAAVKREVLDRQEARLVRPLLEHRALREQLVQPAGIVLAEPLQRTKYGLRATTLIVSLWSAPIRRIAASASALVAGGRRVREAPARRAGPSAPPQRERPIKCSLLRRCSP